MAEKKIRRNGLSRAPWLQQTRHVATVRGLGLRRLHQTVELEDTPQVRGLINRVHYLVRLES